MGMFGIYFAISWLCFYLHYTSAANNLNHGLEEYGIPCIYDGTLKTDADWFGFLANVSIMDSGRMTFEFSYPAERCCQSILFYLEKQMNVLSARMNCWQKESFLRHEDDQILRLTPRFTWSGCHMVHPNGVSTYVCKGGRSFTSKNSETGPTTWYLAVSNCASLRGLELTYHLEIIGHIGECRRFGIETTISPVEPTPVVAESASAQVSDKLCVIEGTLNTSSNWYGYIANLTLLAEGGFNFKLSYPYLRQVQNVILYNEEDISNIRAAQSCWQKEGIIRSRRVPDQILDLSYRSSWNGCVTRNSSQGKVLTCEGKRRYNERRKIFIAVNNCKSRTGLVLKYRFEVAGYEQSPCSLATTLISAKLNILLAVICTICRMAFVNR